MTDKPSEAYLATLTDNTREYIRSLEATITAHEATIKELCAEIGKHQVYVEHVKKNYTFTGNYA